MMTRSRRLFPAPQVLRGSTGDQGSRTPCATRDLKHVNPGDCEEDSATTISPVYEPYGRPEGVANLWGREGAASLVGGKNPKRCPQRNLEPVPRVVPLDHDLGPPRGSQGERRHPRTRPNGPEPLAFSGGQALPSGDRLRQEVEAGPGRVRQIIGELPEPKAGGLHVDALEAPYWAFTQSEEHTDSELRHGGRRVGQHGLEARKLEGHPVAGVVEEAMQPLGGGLGARREGVGREKARALERLRSSPAGHARLAGGPGRGIHPRVDRLFFRHASGAARSASRSSERAGRPGSVHPSKDVSGQEPISLSSADMKAWSCLGGDDSRPGRVPRWRQPWGGVDPTAGAIVPAA